MKMRNFRPTLLSKGSSNDSNSSLEVLTAFDRYIQHCHFCLFLFCSDTSILHNLDSYAKGFHICLWVCVSVFLYCGKLSWSSVRTHTNFCGNMICQYEDRKGSAFMAAKRTAGASTEVNLRNPLQAGEEAHKRGFHPGFETQDRCHQTSKTGVSVVPKRACILQNFLKKNVSVCNI